MANFHSGKEFSVSVADLLVGAARKRLVTRSTIEAELVIQ